VPEIPPETFYSRYPQRNSDVTLILGKEKEEVSLEREEKDPIEKDEGTLEDEDQVDEEEDRYAEDEEQAGPGRKRTD
jgi:hypothetical protein